MTSAPQLSPLQAAPLPLGHSFETRICHDLMAHPELKFSSLVVHRIPDGVCVEGVVTSTANRADVSQVVREVAGVNAVINHLVLRSQPQKG